MLIHPQKSDDKSFSNKLIKMELKVSSAKHLGMTMECNLKWNLHIQALCKKNCKSAAYYQ